jgi:acetoin utilization deacetylase AcuC-like enzyme
MLKIAFAPIYIHPLPAEHRFPMLKYELIPTQLLYEGTATADNFFEPEPATEKLILETHDAIYWGKLKNMTLSPSEIRKTGFPLSKLLIDREITILQGSIQGALYALKYGIAMNIAGGTHHAFTDRGEGFCLLNDIAVAANYLLQYQSIKKILVIDLDVHQGNGTAQIFSHDSRVFTFSMHGENNYPLQKEKSDLDIGLPNGTNDELYLRLLKENLPRLIDEVQPEFAFFQAGVDILETDKLGKLKVSRAGCKERDRFVMECCRKNNIPLAVSMGGGYSEKIADIVEAHANTYRLAQELFF